MRKNPAEIRSVRTLVIAHVFYPHFWAELRACIRNVGSDSDVIITFVDESSVAEARRDLPQARFLLCENRGFDIWPFFKALQSVDLSRYDIVVKLHTKRDIVMDREFVFNNCRFNGAAWRNHLLAFCRTPAAWRKSLARLSEPGVGMVADRHVIVRRRDFPWDVVRTCFDDAVRETRSIDGCWAFDAEKAQYVSGTMFAVRTEPLRFLQKRGFSSGLFEVSGHEREGRILYAHIVENLFGLAVSAVGMRIVASNGSLAWRRVYAPILRFAFHIKETRRRWFCKVAGIPVFWRRKAIAT